MKKKLIRITTVPIAFSLLQGQLRFMSGYFEVLGISSSGNDALNQAGQIEQIKVIPVEMTRKITPIKDLVATWNLYRIFKKEKPHIVHTHTPKAGTLGMLAAYLAKVPHRLHTIAGLPLLEATGSKRLLLDTVEKITYKCATKIYPNSFGLQEIIIKAGYTHKSKLKVIGNGSTNGIDTNHFDPQLFNNEAKLNLRNTLGILNTDFVYIYVGRIVRDKGVNELVEAFATINKVNPNTKLVLVGPFENHLDPLSPETETIIKNHKNIIMVGWQDDVRPYFAIADALTFPSYREGFPNVVMQAGAMGLPSIVSDINGCNEIVKDLITGIIVPAKNTEKLSSAMSLVYSMAKDNNTMNRHKIRESISQRFDRNTIWHAILQEYNSLES